MITIEEFKQAFEKTHCGSNGCNFEKSFEKFGDASNGYHTLPIEALYYTLQNLNSEWQVRLLFADGGVKSYDIFYKIENLIIYVDTINWQTLFFDNIKEAIDILNEKESNIKKSFKTITKVVDKLKENYYECTPLEKRIIEKINEIIDVL